MNGSPLTGSWQSVRSNIPGYQPGAEWLHVSAAGDHVWEIGQPHGKGRPSLNRFSLREDGSVYRFCLVQNGVEVGMPARIERVEADEIVVTPAHGFVTAFRRASKSVQAD